MLASVVATSGLPTSASASASVRRSSAVLRIVGGAPVAAITSFPFQVALFIQSPEGLPGQPSGLAFCGGVIIDPTQLVTAAHCVTTETTGAQVAPANVTALAGSATLPQTVPTQPVASAIAVDPRYNPLTAAYDIAVVTLAQPLYGGAPRADGTASIAPIPLITPQLAAQFGNPNVNPPEPAVISGFGETSPRGVGAQDLAPSLPQQLQAAQTQLVPDATCANDYAPLGKIGMPPITPQMLCAAQQASPAIDACSGDSGGPLLVDTETPAAPPRDYVLAGLIDFGAGCAQPGYPGVYVRLATPEIASFIAQQARSQGQQLVPAPAATAPAPRGAFPQQPAATASGKVSLAARTGRVSRHVARVAVRCLTSTCTGTLTLRTTITLGIARFSIPANSIAEVRVPITHRGELQLARHQGRLRTLVTLRTTGSSATHRTFTITE